MDQSQLYKLVYNCAQWFPPGPSWSTISTGGGIFYPTLSIGGTANCPSRIGLMVTFGVI